MGARTRRDKASASVVTRTESLVLLAVALVALALFHRLEAFERLFQFLEAHEDWQADEAFFVLCLAGFGTVIIAIRRTIDMRREIVGREMAEQRALRLARHDPLTGLANRRVLEEELAELLPSADRARQECAALLIDLDHFKPVNDICGHEAGDALLIAVADRLRRIRTDGLKVFRLGGDEFVAVACGEQAEEIGARLAAQIVRDLGQPYLIDGKSHQIGATVGIARYPADAVQPDDLLRAADIAMYDAKRLQRGTYRFFHSDMDERLRERALFKSDVRGALARGEIRPYFQPVVDLTNDAIIGFEALARWERPGQGVVAPDDFIPVLEELGQMEQLTVEILRAGCTAARAWPPEVTLSVNISPTQFKDDWIAARLLGVLAETGFAPGRLIIEITENAIIADFDRAAAVFDSLHASGIRIALDDFGKGYSSLATLRQLKFDHLKIDGSFVRTMHSAESHKIVSAVAALGRALGMPVTAEGVESEAIAQQLKALGCEQAQGFFFGRPVSAETAAGSWPAPASLEADVAA